MAEPRTTVAVRLSTTGLGAIDRRARDDARTRSDMIRLMLAYAETNMPKGWRPK